MYDNDHCHIKHLKRTVRPMAFQQPHPKHSQPLVRPSGSIQTPSAMDHFRDASLRLRRSSGCESFGCDSNADLRPSGLPPKYEVSELVHEWNTLSRRITPTTNIDFFYSLPEKNNYPNR